MRSISRQALVPVVAAMLFVAAASGCGPTDDSGNACDNPCGAVCCNSGSICVEDSAGNKACATSCTSSSQCPQTAPCCSILTDGESACEAESGQACRCTTGTDCSSGSCAPTVSGDIPVGPYICKPNDGGAWNGCEGSTTCTDPYDCWIDPNGNHYCARSCSDQTCGQGACCDTMTCDNALFACGGSTSKGDQGGACGVCQ